MMAVRNIFIFRALLFALIVLAAAGCQRDGNKRIKTTITGSFSQLAGKSVSLSEFDITSATPLDTVKIDEKGNFRFKFRREGAGFYLVKVDNRNFITLVLDKEKNIRIQSAEASIRKNYLVQGSPDSEIFRDFEMFTEANRNKVDSLSKTFNNQIRSTTFRSLKPELDKEYQDIFGQQVRYAQQFIENHCSSLATLLVLNKRFGERRILTEDDNFSHFVMADSCLRLHYPDNKHLKELGKKITIARQNRRIFDITEAQLAPGKTIPDISLGDVNGKQVRLYSFEGRPVILYFWASWDHASRKANKVIKELAEKSAQKPVVYAIALESYKEMWQEAIRQDGLDNWNNVSDLLNIKSSAKTMFNIPDTFPYFFYLDKDLYIRYKGNDFSRLETELNR
jgi:thiol-disulfide isomerase/thioredoxin